jgi:ribonuclease D
LESVLELRLRLAKEKDRPPFKIFGNDSVLTAIRARPADVQELQETGAFSPKQLRMFGDAIVEAVQAGLAIPEDALSVYPRKPPPRFDPAVPERVRRLRSRRDGIARRMKLNPSLLLSKSQLTAIAAARPRTRSELRGIEGIRRWQVEELGDPILQAMKKG